MAGTVPRRRKAIGHRRRIEDEGEDEGGPEALEALDDDSVTEGSLASDDDDPADDSDTSNIDEASPTSPTAKKSSGNVAVKPARRQQDVQTETAVAEPSTDKPTLASTADTDFMLNGLSIADTEQPEPQVEFDDMQPSPTTTSAPVIVSSSSANNAAEPLTDRRRREHEEYRRKRDEDPAFVPNRGAFFMHDHRHAGPAGNGFRPFGRPGRGRGRGGIGGPFSPMNQLHAPADPITNSQWSHDMHDAVANPNAARQPRYSRDGGRPANGDGHIPTCPPNDTPINRTLSTEKHIGNLQPRVFFPPMTEPRVCDSMAVKQYTKLPDHRPPLRRDKPVRISLPDHPPRYIYPASDRSFIFIPRAMRPNQQRVRGKTRSVLGSVSAFSRRTSIYGGSQFGSQYGSYTPSLALSRRSSLGLEIGRDFIISPTGSAISRPPLPMDGSRPVVRLPPLANPPVPMQMPVADAAFVTASIAADEHLDRPEQLSISDLPPPQTHPLPQKPAFQENRQNPTPLHQPRPQKAVSVENIESPTLSLHPPQPYQQAFHQQVPVQVMNGFSHESHSRHPSYPAQMSTGTPLSQIPERAIHAAPFQPTTYSQQGYYGQSYPMVQQQQQGYFYPTSYGGGVPPPAAAPNFVPVSQQPQSASYGQPAPGDAPAAQSSNPAAPASGPNLIAQEHNGMVYYYDANQLPSMGNYPGYPASQGYPAGAVGMGMGGMVAPSPDGFFYPQTAPGVVYYAQ